MVKKCAMVAALVVMLMPSAASADWLFTPNVGTGFGGSASGREHLTWGASIGWMGAGVLGWEADFAHSPEFFESDDDSLDLIDSSNVTTFMANVIAGIPVGGQTGGGVRPYLAGGLGIMQQAVQDADALFEVDNSEFGINLGGGVMGFATDHVGFRGDLRYFRALGDPEEDNEFDIDFADFNYWRATAGVTFRW
jgi:opacity protein-like surface antigen